MNNNKFDSRTLPLESNEYYHIYNRGNKKINIFNKPENYRYFLKKYADYLSNYIDTYAYCLLPNHFHLLIRVKSVEEFDFIDSEISNDEISKTVTNQFRLFFMSYAKAINRQENLTGSLFQKIFRRKRIDDLNYLFRVVGYIHSNAFLHGIHKSIETYPYSSYQTIISDRTTLLKRKEVLDWFEGKSEFIDSHNAIKDINSEKRFWIED